MRTITVLLFCFPFCLYAGPGAIFQNNKGVGSYKDKDLESAQKSFREALANNAANPVIRFNWASSQLKPYVKEPDPKNPLSEAELRHLGSIAKELEALVEESQKSPKTFPISQKELHYQLAQAWESIGNNQKALTHYYKSLGIPESSENDKTLSNRTTLSIARLLEASDSKSGGGKGGNQSGKGDEDGEGSSQGDPREKGLSQKKQKPEYTGTDLSESQANQIMQSVSNQDRRVQQRKAQKDAQSQTENRGSPNDAASGQSKPW